MAIATVGIEDYAPHDLVYRYGGSRPFHPEIEAILTRDLERYESVLRDIARYDDQVSSFLRRPSEEHPHEPAWDNGFLPVLDTLALFWMVSSKQPDLYVEVGSGNSTKVAARARRLNSPRTRIVSIDPSPTCEIDELCDEVVRGKLEECERTVTEMLSSGDVLFVDGTHRVLQNSDATVFFLEILPRLPSGVYVHLHDIFLPEDYPDPWKQRMYSEQYMMGLLLLFGWEQFETILPVHFVARFHTHLLSALGDLRSLPNLRGLTLKGGSFWFRKR